MNNEIRIFLNENNYEIVKITIKGKVLIVDVGDNIYAIKKRVNNLEELFNYLKSRTFIYYPNILFKTDNYDIYEYINDVEMPREEKAVDMIKLVAVLHKKTTFYKDVDENYYNDIYESILDEINYLNNYYNDLAEVFEREEFESPSHYLFIRNITKVLMCLNYARSNLEEWYKIISEKKRIRIVNIHNNLSLSHYLVSDSSYLISWDKSKKDIPIYDLLKMYKKYYLELDFIELLKCYELIFPWLIEEKRLFFCLIFIPPKINFDDKEFKMCQKVREFYDYLDMNLKFMSDYFPSKEKESTKI